MPSTNPVDLSATGADEVLGQHLAEATGSTDEHVHRADTVARRSCRESHLGQHLAIPASAAIDQREPVRARGADPNLIPCRKRPIRWQIEQPYRPVRVLASDRTQEAMHACVCWAGEICVADRTRVLGQNRQPQRLGAIAISEERFHQMKGGEHALLLCAHQVPVEEISSVARQEPHQMVERSTRRQPRRDVVCTPLEREQRGVCKRERDGAQ